MNKCDVINKVDEILAEPENWVQETFHTVAGNRDCYCLVGAVNKVICGNSYFTDATVEQRLLRDTVCNELTRSVLGLDILKRRYPADAVVEFNDQVERTFDDVKDIIKSTKERVCSE